MTLQILITRRCCNISCTDNIKKKGVGDQERDVPESDSLLKEVVLVGKQRYSETLRIKSVSCSLFHSMLVTESGELFSTGYGVFGQLGMYQ